MSHEKPSFEVATDAEIAELDRSLGYALEYNWGTWRVSEAAREAYGMESFIPTVPVRDIQPAGALANAPSLDIWLKAPNEVPIGIGPEADQDNGIPVVKVRSHALLHSAGVAIILQSNYSQEEIRFAAVARATTDDLRQSIDRIVPLWNQFAIFTALRTAPVDPLAEWHHWDESEQLRHRQQIIGRWIGGLGVAAVALDTVMQQRLRPLVPAAVALAITGNALWARWQSAQLAREQASESSEAYRMTLEEFAGKVADEVASAYNPATFDEHMGRMLGQG